MKTVITTTPADKALADAFSAVTASSGARQAAWDAYARTGLPHRRIEEWRWSDVRRAVNILGERAVQRAEGELIAPSRAPEAREPLHAAPPAPMPALAAALSDEAIVFRVSGEPAEPLRLDMDARAGTSHQVIRVEVEAGAAARVEETYRGEAGAFANLAILYRLGECARLDRIVRQAASPEAVLVSTAGVELATDAQLRQATLAFGAKLARLETHVQHAGEGARAVIDGAYLLEGDLHADQTSVVTHAAPGCATEQTVKGAVRDKATGVFQGRFLVERGAQRTDARMGHHALLLSEGAGVNAKPELEIYADDVQCAHGNTAGALDPDQLFYLQARGLPEDLAKALVTEAFIAEAFDRVADENLREAFLTDVRGWLGRTQ